MICYASRTGKGRNLDALRAAGWRLLISRAGRWRTEGMPYALDNGAWSDFQNGQAFDAEAFRELVERFAFNADWIVAPDLVAGGHASLAMSVDWLPYLAQRSTLVLLAVQDGMRPEDLVDLVGPRVGIFLGGSTQWKLDQMQLWGEFCAERRAYYHVARVNTVRRIYRAAAAGARSIDGSSASRYSVNLPRLDSASRQADFLAPTRDRSKAV